MYQLFLENQSAEHYLEECRHCYAMENWQTQLKPQLNPKKASSIWVAILLWLKRLNMH